MGKREKGTLRLSVRVSDLVAKEIGKGARLGESDLRSGRRQGKVSRERRFSCQLLVRKMGYPGAEVARFLGVTTSAVSRAAFSEGLPELQKYLDVYSEGTFYIEIRKAYAPKDDREKNYLVCYPIFTKKETSCKEIRVSCTQLKF